MRSRSLGSAVIYVCHVTTRVPTARDLPCLRSRRAVGRPPLDAPAARGRGGARRASVATRPRGVRAMKPCLDEVRLVDVLDRLGFLPNRHRDRSRRRPGPRRGLRRCNAGSRGRHGRARGIDVEHGESVVGDVGGDVAVGAHFGEVADAVQQPVGDARRAARAASRSRAAPACSMSTPADRAERSTTCVQLVGRVVVEAGHEPEAVAKGAGDHARARRGADERERLELEVDRTCRRTLAEDDVDGRVLHRRVQHLFDGAVQAMDLVDEQHVAGFEVRRGSRRGRRRVRAPARS